MKKLIYILLLAFSFPAFAGDSGDYFDLDKNGEGLNLGRNGDTIFFKYYTYGGDSECGEPVVSPSIPTCELNGQRWFFGVDTYNEISESLTGNFYITEGVDFPFGADGNVGDATIVGRYTLVRDLEGWALFVTRFGTTLSQDDPLFDDVIGFPIKLFESTD